VVNEREGLGPTPVQSPLSLFATLISPSTALEHTFLDSPTRGRKGYVHVTQTSGYNTNTATGSHIRIVAEDGRDLELKEGDGAYIFAESGKTLKMENIGDKTAEVLLFDLE